MSNHTPRPWKVEYQSGDMPYIVADQGRGWNNPVICSLYEDVTPETSVTIGGWLEANENAETNARLIAAAPDMLDALRAAEDSVGDLKTLEIVRAAIAKATGVA